MSLSTAARYLRAATCHAICCGLLVAGPPGQTPEAAAPKRKTKIIDGRVSPELIPEVIVWQTALDDLHVFVYGKGTEPRAERLQALSRLSLHVPLEDARLAAEVARDTMQKVFELRRPLEDEHAGAVTLAWTPEQRTARAAAIEQTVLTGRDDLSRRLPPRSFRALKRWIADSVLPGLQVAVPERDK
jgi:hypothetical protein